MPESFLAESIKEYITALHEIGHTLGMTDKLEQFDIMYKYAEDDTPLTISQNSINEIIEKGDGGSEETPEESNKIMNYIYELILSLLKGNN